MLMLQGIEKAFGECANQIVNKYDIKVSVDKITLETSSQKGIG